MRRLSFDLSGERNEKASSKTKKQEDQRNQISPGNYFYVKLKDSISLGYDIF